MAEESHGQSRREFLSKAGFAAAALAVGGYAGDRPKVGGAGAMSAFAAPPLARVRVGVVGVGSRGTYALKRLAFMPGVEIAAFCDVSEAAMKRCREFLAQKKLPPAREFLGPVAYKDLCQWDGVDVVYACVPWKLHAPVALAAMRADKHAFVEVPATMDVDSCWELVETSEATRRHCMMLENCCYGEHEMLALNMCRLGVLGETVYGEAGYLHSGKTRGFKLSEFRAEWYQEHRGNYYPTHGLGPVAQYMNINRGDRFDYLNSMETTSIGDLIRAGDPRWNGENLETYKKYLIGGYSSSLIHTVNGKIILLNLSCPVPHPYSRINTIQGTHGVFMDYPLRIDVESATPSSTTGSTARAPPRTARSTATRSGSRPASSRRRRADTAGWTSSWTSAGSTACRTACRSTWTSTTSPRGAACARSRRSRRPSAARPWRARTSRAARGRR